MDPPPGKGSRTVISLEASIPVGTGQSGSKVKVPPDQDLQSESSSPPRGRQTEEEPNALRYLLELLKVAMAPIGQEEKGASLGAAHEAEAVLQAIRNTRQEDRLEEAAKLLQLLGVELPGKTTPSESPSRDERTSGVATPCRSTRPTPPVVQSPHPSIVSSNASWKAMPGVPWGSSGGDQGSESGKRKPSIRKGTCRKCGGVCNLDRRCPGCEGPFCRTCVVIHLPECPSLVGAGAGEPSKEGPWKGYSPPDLNKLWSPEKDGGEERGEGLYTLVRTPAGTVLAPVPEGRRSGGSYEKDPEAERLKDLQSNAKAQLPYYLYWDGERRADGTAMSLIDWEKRLRGWRKEFASGMGLGVKAMNGLTDLDLWSDVERQGTDELCGENGIETLITRVRGELLSKGVHLQAQRYQEYQKARSRPPGMRMKKHVDEVNDLRKRLASSLGLKAGEEHMAVNDRLHGLKLLETASISKLEQRQIQRDNVQKAGGVEEALDSALVGADLVTMYWDVHNEELNRRRGSGPRRRRHQGYTAQRDLPRPHQGDGGGSSSSSASGSGSEESSSGSGSEDDDGAQGFVAAAGESEESDGGSQKSADPRSTVSLSSQEVDGLTVPNLEAYVGYRSAKEVVNQFQKQRGFEGTKNRRSSSSGRRREGGSSQGRRGSRPRKEKKQKRERTPSRGQRRRSESVGSRGRKPSRDGSRGGRSRSGSRPGERGACAICGEGGHWKNECPHKGTELDRGPKPPRKPPSKTRMQAPSGPRRHKSFFASLIAPVCMLSCYMAESLRISSPSRRGLSTTVVSPWWERVSRLKPDFAERWEAQKKGGSQEAWVWDQKAAAEKEEEEAKKFSPVLPYLNICNRASSWKALSKRSRGRSGVMDSACNKTMIGELTLLKHEQVLREKYGLGIHRYKLPQGDFIKFGDAEVVEADEIAVRPIGMRGLSGELEMTVIPKADTPLLIAKDDFAALKTFVGFGVGKAIYSAIDSTVVELPETLAGHYEVLLNEFPPPGP